MLYWYLLKPSVNLTYIDTQQSEISSTLSLLWSSVWESDTRFICLKNLLICLIHFGVSRVACWLQLRWQVYLACLIDNEKRFLYLLLGLHFAAFQWKNNSNPNLYYQCVRTDHNRVRTDHWFYILCFFSAIGKVYVWFLVRSVK